MKIEQIILANHWIRHPVDGYTLNLSITGENYPSADEKDNHELRKKKTKGINTRN